MAKIALISQKISPQVLALARGLLSQRHEVQIITSYKASLETSEEFQILSYFKKWSWLEALKLLPRFVGHAPDVFHFIFENEDEHALTSHWVLSTFAQQMKKAVVVSLGVAKLDTKRWKQNPFLKNCRAVIVPSREKLMYLKRQDLIGESAISEVILPFAALKLPHETESTDSTPLQNLSRQWRPYILVPAHPERKLVDQLHDLIHTSGSNAKPRLVFLGKRSEKLYSDLRCISISQTTESELQVLVSNSQAVFLIAHQYEPAELMRWQQLAVKSQTPLIVHRRQTEVLPGLCLHDKSGFVLDNFQEDFRKLLQDNPLLKIAKYQRPAETQTPSDLSLNEVNRLYARMIAFYS